MYLLDTNVISELRKGGRANHGVTAFFATLAAEDIYLSVVTIGEIRRGLEIRSAREETVSRRGVSLARLDKVATDFS